MEQYVNVSSMEVGAVNTKSGTKNNSRPHIIHEDTRQKQGEHTLKQQYFTNAGWTIIRTKLYVGDYMLPGGLRTVDTKASIYELGQNLRQQHDRFRNECMRAQEAGYKLTILVENEDGVGDLWDLADWVEPMAHFTARKRKSKGRVKKRISGTQLFKACRTMAAKYGVEFMFCTPQEAGACVLSILKEGEHGGDVA